MPGYRDDLERFLSGLDRVAKDRELSRAGRLDQQRKDFEKLLSILAPNGFSREEVLELIRRRAKERFSDYLESLSN
jgi:hypothetical protein